MRFMEMKSVCIDGYDTMQTTTLEGGEEKDGEGEEVRSCRLHQIASGGEEERHFKLKGLQGQRLGRMEVQVCSRIPGGLCAVVVEKGWGHRLSTEPVGNHPKFGNRRGVCGEWKRDQYLWLLGGGWTQGKQHPRQ